MNALRAVAAPKPKFSFKRKTATVANPVTPSKPNKSNPVSTTSELPHSNPLISSHTYAYLTTASLIGSPPTSCLTVSDLDYCVLNFLPTTGASELEVSAIHLRKISNSVLLLPLVNGSILAHDLSRCVVVVGCHQVEFLVDARSRKRIHRNILVSYAHFDQGGRFSLYSIQSDRGGLPWYSVYIVSSDTTRSGAIGRRSEDYTCDLHADKTYKASRFSLQLRKTSHTSETPLLRTGFT